MPEQQLRPRIDAVAAERFNRSGDQGVRTFRWLSADQIPAAFDLQRCGWRLVAGGASEGEARIALAHADNLDAGDWLRLLNPLPPLHRRSIILAGVNDAGERARLLHLGFGEVVAGDIAFSEFEARALRVAEMAASLPARRVAGPLTLDLLERDCRVGERALRLHPREFALLWRLADAPGVPVSKRALLADVWHLGFVPETNSLAVHVFRLRARLAQAGLANVIRTDASDGYALVVEAGPPGLGQSQVDAGSLDDDATNQERNGDA